MTETNSEKREGPTKHERGDVSKKRVKVTGSTKTKMMLRYKSELERGLHREGVLGRLSKKYDKSTRTIERYIASAKEDGKKREAASQTTSEDSARGLLERRQAHFEDIVGLLSKWKDQLVFDVAGPLSGHEVTWPVVFWRKGRRQDGSPGSHGGRGALHWSVGSAGEVNVWFSIEREALFRCLKPHVPDEELWSTFDELKQELSKTIGQIVAEDGPDSVSSRGALGLASQTADALEIAIARGSYAGRCGACPPER